MAGAEGGLILWKTIPVQFRLGSGTSGTSGESLDIHGLASCTIAEQAVEFSLHDR